MDDALVGLWVLALIVAAYFVPAIIGFQRNVPNRWSVFVINLLLGWTLVGWAVALAMAVRDKPTPSSA